MSAPPLRRGALFALASAACFGATTPALEHFGRGVDPIAAGALVYLGAGFFAIFMLLRRGALFRRGHEAPLDKRSSPRVLLMTLFGAVLAPVALFYGLAGVDAATASLLLTLEAPFTWALARLVYREHMGRRALLAAAFITAGGVLLAGVPKDAASLAAALFVALAALAWAADNTVSRSVAHLDPLLVVAAKGVCGASASALAALLLGARWPERHAAGALVLSGALGIGLSLVLYLGAQRRMGAGRTASVFATAPFFGVAASLLVGARPSPLPFALAAAAVALGVVLHVTERHAHAHHHHEVEHEHAHSHDDGHHDHDHEHEPPPAGPHSHPHRHDALSHEHEHADDLHHGHEH